MTSLRPGSSLRLGVSLRNAGPDAREAVRRLPELAVELGLDTVWASDHVVAPPEIADRYGTTWLDPVVVLAGVAERFPALGLGISALVLPYRPVLPKPPVPRAVSLTASLSRNSGVSCRANTSCAIRSPRRIGNGSAPPFCRITFSSPR